MTIAIAARSAETGMFGIVITSSSPAVAARCAHARAGVGVLGTQNITDPRLGPAGLDLMANGSSAEEAIATLCRTSPHIEFRQLIAVEIHEARNHAAVPLHAIEPRIHVLDDPRPVFDVAGQQKRGHMLRDGADIRPVTGRAHAGRKAGCIHRTFPGPLLRDGAAVEQPPVERQDRSHRDKLVVTTHDRPQR